MTAARNPVAVQRPATDVFAFIADGLNGPMSRSGILDIALVSGSGVGPTYKQAVKVPGGRRIDADDRVTACEPNHHLAFEGIAGPFRPTREYVLDEVTGATQVTFDLRAGLGGIQKLVLGGMVQKTMDAEVAGVDRLERVLEGS